MCRYMKFIRVGPGGIDCPCCGMPAPGKRKKAFKKAKRKEKLDAMKCEELNYVKD